MSLAGGLAVPMCRTHGVRSITARLHQVHADMAAQVDLGGHGAVVVTVESLRSRGGEREETERSAKGGSPHVWSCVERSRRSRRERVSGETLCSVDQHEARRSLKPVFFFLCQNRKLRTAGGGFFFSSFLFFSAIFQLSLFGTICRRGRAREEPIISYRGCRDRR